MDHHTLNGRHTQAEYSEAMVTVNIPAYSVQDREKYFSGKCSRDLMFLVDKKGIGLRNRFLVIPANIPLMLGLKYSICTLTALRVLNNYEITPVEVFLAPFKA